MTPRFAVLAIPFILLAAHANAAEADTEARASFPLVPSETTTARDSALTQLDPKVSASLPDVGPPLPPPLSLPPPTPAPRYRAQPAWQPAPGIEPIATRSATHDREPRTKTSDEWMLSIEGVTHAPVDLGFQVGLELPIGLRFFGGYGVMPALYRGLITDAASSEDDGTRALVENAFDSGNAWRVTVGIRPFKKLGLYFDAGYSRVSLSGSASAEELTGISGVTAPSYSANTSIDMWLFEVGYQALIADRIVVGVGAGAMGALGSSTRFTSEGSSTPVFPEESQKTDHALESYAIPTLTLRLGVDLI